LRFRIILDLPIFTPFWVARRCCSAYIPEAIQNETDFLHLESCFTESVT
jgi:hypothetical protein